VLTITGTSFPALESDLTLEIAGVSCTVMKSTFDTVFCKVDGRPNGTETTPTPTTGSYYDASENSTSALFVGGRGISHEILTTSSPGTTRVTEFAAMNISGGGGSSSSSSGAAGGFAGGGQRVMGFFRAPFTSNYSFEMAVDTQTRDDLAPGETLHSTTSAHGVAAVAELYVGTSQAPASKVLHLSTPVGGYDARKPYDWVRVFSTGIYGDGFDVGEAEFNRLANETGVIRRLCADCAPTHYDLVYQRTDPKHQQPRGGYYSNMLEVWTNRDNVLNQHFRLYGSEADFGADRNRFQTCNYNDFRNKVGELVGGYALCFCVCVCLLSASSAAA
jgi:hypothetical protein